MGGSIGKALNELGVGATGAAVDLGGMAGTRGPGVGRVGGSAPQKPANPPVGPGRPAVPTIPSIRGSDVKTTGVQVRGRFPTTPQTPNTVMYRTDDNGVITSYQVWAADGLPAYRVDVTGASHGSIPTPHVIEFGRDMAPSGQVFVAKPSLPRPATPVEIL